MFGFSTKIAPDGAADSDCILLYALILCNLGCWTWAGLAFADHPVLLGSALLAWLLGLRHALDADHIAAIDGVLRTLLRSGHRSASVGLFFALGHSLVVFVVAIIAIVATSPLITMSPALRTGLGVAGGIFCSMFLIGVALVNLVILAGLRAPRPGLRATRQGDDAGRPAARLIGRITVWLRQRPYPANSPSPWRMILVGALFALGFDTATEIALLGLAAREIGANLSPWLFLLFPLLFAAGMTLVDSADNALMLRAYTGPRDPASSPIRLPQPRQSYNVLVTALSAAVALMTGLVVALNLLTEQFALEGAFWRALAGMNAHSAWIGASIAGLFALGFAVSVAQSWRARRQLGGA